MNPLATTFLILFLLALAGLLFVVWRKKSQDFARVLAEEEAIIQEERRMFSFLHDLGEASSRVDAKGSMHRLIVEGAMRVSEAGGGALYLIDADGKTLVPRFISDECPPLIALSDEMRVKAVTSPHNVLSHLRLQPARSEEGLLGGVFSSAKPVLLAHLRDDPTVGMFAREAGRDMTLMAGVLSSGSRKLGVLAVTADAARRTFSQNDFEVFNSLCEQSAFALANAMAHQDAAAKRQIEGELKSAGEIQRVLLPAKDPVLEGFTVAGRNIPARVLSGDFYDYLTVAGEKFGAVIADVSGKGTAAALIAAMCRSVLRSFAPGAATPAGALGAVNRLLFPDIREDMFISMIYLTLDPARGEVTLARAGHTYPLVWRAESGVVEEMKSGGLALGIDRGDVFERVTKDMSFTMRPGDCMLLYTDGVNEAMDTKGDEFGEPRVREALARLAPQGARAVIDGIIAEVDAFSGGKRSHDDITLIALQRAA